MMAWSMLRLAWAGVDTSKLDLNTTLASLNIDQAIITNLTTTFTDPHQLFSLFTQPEKLKAELTEKTGMDEQTITGFVDTIKTWKPSSGEPGLRSDSPFVLASASSSFF